MFDGNWKSWALIIALIGGAVEIVKHMPAQDSPTWNNENLRAEDDQPYSVSDDEVDKSQPKLPERFKAPNALPVLQKEAKAFAVANAVTSTDSNKKDAKGLVPAATPGEEFEEVIDPVTGKKTLVKKKKKKKKKEDKKDTTAVTIPTLPDPNALSALLDPNADLGAAVAAAAAAPPGTALPSPGTIGSGGAQNNNIYTLQEWEKLLLSSPNRSETLIFIKDYQSNLVTAQTYYTIVGMMLNDSRADMKQLGLLAAGSVQSAQAFTLLATVDKTDTTGTLKSTADTYLAKYAAIGSLGILRTVLSGSDTHAAQLAAQQVDTLARATLGATASSGSGGGNNGNAAQFEPFLNLLHGLINSSDSGLAQQAQQTYQDLSTELADAGINTSVTAASAQEP